jgi:hypothetical protein
MARSTPSVSTPVAQQPRNFFRRHDQAIFAVNGKDAANHRRVQAEHRQIDAICLTHAGYRGRVGMDGHQLGVALFIDEAHPPGANVEGIADPAIQTGSAGRIAAPIVHAAQFLLEIIRGNARTGIELERCSKDVRRHRPMATLKLFGHHAIQMHDPGAGNRRDNGQDHKDHDQNFAPEATAGSGH